MKKLSFLLLFLAFSGLKAQIVSGIYRFPFPENREKQKAAFVQKELFNSPTLDFEIMQMDAVILNKKKPFNHLNPNKETLIILKKGNFTISQNSVSQDLGPGSVILAAPGVETSLKSTPGSTFYLMQYKAREHTNKNKLLNSMYDWNNLEFKPHDKGGRRNVVDSPTAECKRLEMHITTLNQDLESHPPHTHRAAEIILLKTGNGDMIVGSKKFPGLEGDLWFVESMVSHNITNTDTKPITYFAYQFE